MTLVDDLLDVSRIARGKVQLKRERVDFADVTARAIEMTSPAIDDRRHVLTVQVPRGSWCTPTQARLAQVVANLFTNAAKYTDSRGHIRISAQHEGFVLPSTVTDNGRGIDPEILPRVFELFSQERQEIDRSRGGLGLGLAIVKSLVEAHGGRVRRERGQGARRRVRRRPPARRSTQRRVSRPITAEQRASAWPKHGRRIFVVDDNQDAAELLAESLDMLGHTTRAVFDGPARSSRPRSFARRWRSSISVSRSWMDSRSHAPCAHRRDRRESRSSR